MNWGKLLAALHERHPWDDQFAAEIEAKIRARCSAVPCHVHKPDQAELALEQAVREAIVECYLVEYEEAWFPITVRKNWPIADAIIEGDEAFIRFSVSPEVDALLGGNQRPRLRVKIRPAPPNIYQKAAGTIGRMLRREPQVRPELELTAKAPARAAPPAPAPAKTYHAPVKPAAARRPEPPRRK